MKIHWLSSALNELDGVYEYIARDNPGAARATFVRIQSATLKLAEFPESGRLGSLPGTREVVVPGLPYLVAYRVRPARVEILRVFHASMNIPVVKSPDC